MKHPNIQLALCAAILPLLMPTHAQARNPGAAEPIPALGGTLVLDAYGLTLERAEGNVTLSTSGWGKPGQLSGDPPALPEEVPCSTLPLRWRPVNCQTLYARPLSSGLELWQLDENPHQSWLLPSPRTPMDTLEIEVAVEGATPIQEGVNITLISSDAPLHYQGLNAWDASGRMLAATMGSEDQSIRIQVDVAGAVWPVYVDPVVSTASTTLTEPSTDFGIGVSLGGDVNNDGYDDVLIGARFGVNQYGQAFSYHGSATGTQTEYSSKYTGADYYGTFGTYVDNQGDINGDGYADALISEFYSARILVYMGSSTGLEASSSLSLTGPSGFGRTLAMLGDINKDGYGDVGVGSQSHKVSIYLGSATGLNPTAALTLTTGSNVFAIGDINNDGYRDFGVVDETTASLLVYHGGASVSAEVNVTLEVSGLTELDYCISHGDFNHDGYDDLVTGAPSAASGAGAAYIYTGSATGLSKSRFQELSNPGTSSAFGANVAGIPDANGDGYDDLAVSTAYNLEVIHVYVFHGSSSGLLTAPVNTLYSTAVGFGYAMSSGGDVNADGYADLLVGAFQGQSAYVYHGCSDTDHDGYCADLDCNDDNAAINPAATEACDLIDNDCNSTIDEGVTTTYYKDNDGDGYGSITSGTTSACSKPSGYATSSTDCNDAQSDVFEPQTYYIDADDDGFGASNSGTDLCEATPPSGYADNDSDNCPAVSNTDQADLDADTQGDACDLDADGDTLLAQNDCDDHDDQVGAPTPFYADDDGDGIGETGKSTTACSTPSGFVATVGDNCPAVSNVDQLDSDGDGQGDACEVTSPTPEEAASPTPEEEMGGGCSCHTSGTSQENPMGTVLYGLGIGLAMAVHRRRVSRSGPPPLLPEPRCSATPMVT